MVKYLRFFIMFSLTFSIALNIHQYLNYVALLKIYSTNNHENISKIELDIKEQRYYDKTKELLPNYEEELREIEKDKK